ncbi:Arginase/deacetylase [Cystobasidium minutum MCA 4210]|uniref:Arginase/deacetylase n=1 Tax=Cystobasidium minutum MCA 4210 TaxID=1397322 RepID=UPI0034CD60E3|eukprot:jgi/Rhomi1/159512/estExt_Genewise1Plus.C_3_t20272
MTDPSILSLKDHVRPDETSPPSPLPPRVVYVTSAETRSYADLLPSNRGRSSLVHSLIESLELLEEQDAAESSSDESEDSNPDGDVHAPAGKEGKEKQDDSPVHSIPSSHKARVLEVASATRNDLCRFHDKIYINALFEAAANVEVESPETSFDFDSAQPSPKKRMRIDPAPATDEVVSFDTVHQQTLDPDESLEDHGLEHDCPVFHGLEEYCSHIAGGSITAAKELRQGRADIAIFWDGGRHHATKSAAAGFCYVNDIVLSILELQKSPLQQRAFSSFPSLSASSASLNANRPLKRLKKILYIDLDLHHGDGVAEAFETNPNVITASLHLWNKGFYPSTPKGHIDYTGPPPPSPASHTTFNIAVSKSGLSDANLNRLVEQCIALLFGAVQPDAVVVQCGVDGLAGDPCKEFNISLTGYGKAVQTILSLCGHAPSISLQTPAPCTAPVPDETQQENKQDVPIRPAIPVLMLGGGGYNHTNAARAWAYLTSLALGRPLDLASDTIPEYCPHWEMFYNDKNGNGEGMDVPAHISRRDENSESDIERIIVRFRGHIEEYKR